jgi:osmotically inducible lipoprotein OsmB
LSSNPRSPTFRYKFNEQALPHGHIDCIKVFIAHGGVMKRFLAVGFAALLAGGCATWDGLSGAEKGAVIGAGTGAAVGSATVGGTVGTVGGAAVGGVAGHQIGKREDRRAP